MSVSGSEPADDVSVCRWHCFRGWTHGREWENPTRCLPERGAKLSDSSLEQWRGRIFFKKIQMLAWACYFVTLMCAFSMCKLKPMFFPLGLDWCGDCCFPSKGIWRRSVSIPHNEITAQMSIFDVIPMHIWSISVRLPEATVWQCGLWVSLCACVCSPKSASVSPTLNRAVFEGSATLYRHGYLLQH